MSFEVILEVMKMKKQTKKWKESNKEYLKELQAFLDAVENVKNKELRDSIRYHMLKCDDIVTTLAEDMFSVYYEEGAKTTRECIKK